MKLIDTIALILLVIGGVNWALFGLLNINLVDLAFAKTGMATVMYVLVGLSAVWGAIAFGHNYKSQA